MWRTIEEQLKREFTFTYNNQQVTGTILNRTDSIDKPKEYLGEYLSEGMDWYRCYKQGDKFYAVLSSANMYIR
jgi:hypothetical protein